MIKNINGVNCKVVDTEFDVYFDMALTMLEEIKYHNERGEKTVMIVPVGPTQHYPILAEMVNRLKISLKNVHFFNMDEYMVSPTEAVGPEDPLSFYGRMKREFYDRVHPDLVMPESQRHFPAPGKEAEYDRLIEELGGVDVCFGGLGINGHVAFNDPGEADFNDPRLVKVVKLDERCRQQQVNDGCFPTLNDVPKQAMSLTMSFIMSVPNAICVVPTDRKANAVYGATRGPVTTACPASILRQHKNAGLYLDKASASKIL